MKILPKLILTCLLIIMTHILVAQNRLTAFLSQDGNLSFRITIDDFYFQISQSGRITEFGTLIIGNVSYNVNGKVDRIGTTNISYNVSDKVDRVGSTNISYGLTGRVDRIGSTSISYDVSDRIDRIGSTDIFYNVYDKVDRIGSSTIFYNVYNKVDRVIGSEGLIVFRNKTTTTDD